MSSNTSKKKVTKLLIRNTCWIFFSVILSFLPFSTIIYIHLAGYSVKIREYIPDMILVVISIGINFVNLCIDTWKKIDPIPRIIIPLISALVILLWWGFYSFIKGGALNNLNICLILTINIIFAVSWLVGGIIINCITSKKEKTQ